MLIGPDNLSLGSYHHDYRRDHPHDHPHDGQAPGTPLTWILRRRARGAVHADRGSPARPVAGPRPNEGLQAAACWQARKLASTRASGHRAQAFASPMLGPP
eukprot:scaffold1970_cov396-Prasinococcus_capsulatus_cf.AAC.8